jgi:hypothetical protein
VAAVALGLAAPCLAGDQLLVDVLRSLEDPAQMELLARVQLLHMPYAVQTQERVTEHVLHETADQRCEMDLPLASYVAFLDALRAAQPATTSQQADLRWGAIFLDAAGRPLHSVYVNGSYFLAGTGRIGYIDGINVALKSGMAMWFERSMATCLQQNAH